MNWTFSKGLVSIWLIYYRAGSSVHLCPVHMICLSIFFASLKGNANRLQINFTLKTSRQKYTCENLLPRQCVRFCFPTKRSKYFRGKFYFLIWRATDDAMLQHHWFRRDLMEEELCCPWCCWFSRVSSLTLSRVIFTLSNPGCFKWQTEKPWLPRGGTLSVVNRIMWFGFRMTWSE